MAIHIREARIPEELELLRTIHNANRERLATPERFEWSYLRNPWGRARAWLAIDEKDDVPVGFTAVFPRAVRVNDRAVSAWACGDFSIKPKYRTLGVALKLRRAARDAVDAGVSSFFYAHPNERMAHIHARAGHPELGRMVRYFKLLALPRAPASVRWLSTWPARAIGLESFVRVKGELEIVQATAPPDIGLLYDRASPELGVSLVRSPEYVTWRFLQTPLDHVELAILRRSGHACAYAAFAAHDEFVAIRDWLSDGAEAFDSVVTAVVRQARARGKAWVSVSLLEGHPDVARFRRLGFLRKREFSRVFAYAHDPSVRATVLDQTRWFMTAGDHDV